MNFKYNKNKIFVSIILGVIFTYFATTNSFAANLSFLSMFGSGVTGYISLTLIFGAIVYILYSMVQKQESNPPMSGIGGMGGLGDMGLGNLK